MYHAISQQLRYQFLISLMRWNRLIPSFHFWGRKKNRVIRREVRVQTKKEGLSNSYSTVIHTFEKINCYVQVVLVVLLDGTPCSLYRRTFALEAAHSEMMTFCALTSRSLDEKKTEMLRSIPFQRAIPR